MKTADNRVLMELAEVAGWNEDDLKHVTIIGEDPLFYTRFRPGEAFSGVYAAIGLAVAKIWELKTGRKQHVTVDMQECIAAMQNFFYTHIETAADLSPDRDPRKPTMDQMMRGKVIPLPETGATLLTGVYKTKDDRWFYVHAGVRTEKILELMKCEQNADSLAAACAQYTADELEQLFFDNKLCGVKVRTREEWEESEQGKLLRATPAVIIEKFADNEKKPFPEGNRPLSGIRVLESTRILSGPSSAREMASHGADVLWVGSPKLRDTPLFEIDTGHGKRAAYVDIKEEGGIDTLWGLIKDTDVFVQNATLKSQLAREFSSERVLERYPGKVYVQINAFGTDGPWADMPGWEQILQAATGVMDVEATLPEHEYDPRGAETGGIAYDSYHLPDGMPRILGAAFNDYITGGLAAFGTLVALYKRATMGGSYVVKTNLARSSMVLTGLGLLEKDLVMGMPDLAPQDIVDKMTIDEYSPLGHLRYLRSCIHLSETDPWYERPTIKRGTSKPVWEE